MYVKGPPKATSKKDIFTDDYVKIKKFLPAPCAYTDQEKGFKKTDLELAP